MARKMMLKIKNLSKNVLQNTHISARKEALVLDIKTTQATQ